jgi:hypothetical protein
MNNAEGMTPKAVGDRVEATAAAVNAMKARIKIIDTIKNWSAKQNEPGVHTFDAYLQESLPTNLACVLAAVIHDLQQAQRPAGVHALGTPVVVHSAGHRLQVGKVVAVRTTLGVLVSAGGSVNYGDPKTGVSYQVYCDGDQTPHGGLPWHDAGSVFTSVTDLAFMQPFLAGAK